MSNYIKNRAKTHKVEIEHVGNTNFFKVGKKEHSVFLKFGCDCHYFTIHKKPCSHIIAAMKKILEDGKIDTKKKK